MRISDWSSDVCSSDLHDVSSQALAQAFEALHFLRPHWLWALLALPLLAWAWRQRRLRRSAWRGAVRSEEHTSELQSLMRISYAVFCLKKKKNHRSIDERQNT